MACCGLCRPKVKPTIKTKKNITIQKIHAIDTWIENIDGPYETIDLPNKSPTKPIKMSNQEELAELDKSDQISQTSSVSSSEQNIPVENNHPRRRSGRQNFTYLSSELSTNEKESFTP